MFTLPVKEAIRRGLVDSKSAAAGDDNDNGENLLVDISDPPAFGIGSRVECPLLRCVSGYDKLDSYSGTVMKHNVTLGKAMILYFFCAYLVHKFLTNISWTTLYIITLNKYPGRSSRWFILCCPILCSVRLWRQTGL